MGCIHLCDTKLAIRFRLCWRHSDDLLVCFGTKPTQRTEDEISRESGSGGWKEGPKEDGESCWQSRAEEDSRLEIAAWRRTQSTEDISIVTGFCRSFTNKQKNTLAIVYKSTENAKCLKLLFLRLELTKSVFVRLFFFFHPLGSILCGRKEMGNIPSRKWEK